MDERMRGVLGLSLVIAALAFAYAVVAFVGVYGDANADSLPSFTVSGEGRAVAVPDTGRFMFGVITEGGSNISNLQEENAERTNHIISFLKERGVADEDIRTENYSVEPRYQSFSCPATVGRPCPPPEIVGYTIRNTVSVKVRELDNVGDILSGVVERGANDVSQLTFTVDDPAGVENKARAEALAKAEAKAKATAEAGGFRLGKLLSIQEASYPVPYPVYGIGGAEDAFRETAVVPTIEPGSEKVTISVILRYEIK